MNVDAGAEASKIPSDKNSDVERNFLEFAAKNGDCWKVCDDARLILHEHISIRLYTAEDLFGYSFILYLLIFIIFLFRFLLQQRHTISFAY